MPESVFPPALRTLFQTDFGLNEAELARVAAAFRAEALPRKAFFLEAGRIADRKAYLVRGSVQTFFTDEQARDHILMFRFEDSWLGDVESYHTQCPSRISIQALEDCDLLVVSRTDFSRLETEIPALQRWYAVNAVRMYAALFEKLREAKMRTPEEKYRHLLATQPGIFQRVPLQNIAAYLEIEPPSLSRLRKRVWARRKDELNPG